MAASIAADIAAPIGSCVSSSARRNWIRQFRSYHMHDLHGFNITYAPISNTRQISLIARRFEGRCADVQASNLAPEPSWKNQTPADLFL
jgi:hypothetical protein